METFGISANPTKKRRMPLPMGPDDEADAPDGLEESRRAAGRMEQGRRQAVDSQFSTKDSRAAGRAVRDYNRRTDGVLGASNGGTGKTPEDAWRASFGPAKMSADVAVPASGPGVPATPGRDAMLNAAAGATAAGNVGLAKLSGMPVQTKYGTIGAALPGPTPNAVGAGGTPNMNWLTAKPPAGYPAGPKPAPTMATIQADARAGATPAAAVPSPIGPDDEMKKAAKASLPRSEKTAA